MTFILDLPPELGLERANSGAGQAQPTNSRAKKSIFMRNCAARFLEIARAEPQRCRVIDASRPAEAVAESIWSAFSDELGFWRRRGFEAMGVTSWP